MVAGAHWLLPSAMKCAIIDTTEHLGQRYIIELKIRRGERYNAEGEQQLREYLDYFQLDMGYMLSFNFNKNKRQDVEQVQVGDKILIEAML
ncbi:MAG: hypothetical protein K5695_04975 [Oscillospiraceae bacterium]|nr:hypothetical protein [Oscillospiraceae bacterium]